MKKIIYTTVLIAILSGAHVYLGLGPIKHFAPTYDEPVHLTAGVVYWKTGNYLYNGLHHPPLGEMWAAIPVALSGPIVPVLHPAWLARQWTPQDQYRFADAFLYHNRISADRMMTQARVMQLIMSCLLGAMIVIVTLDAYGAVAALFAGLFWAFSAAFLANGTIVSTDLSFSVFFFGFFCCLKYFPSWKAAALAGLFLGFAFASKYFALSIPIAALALFPFMPELRKSGRPWLITLAVGFFALGIVYRFSDLNVFWSGFTNLFSRSQAGRSSFFLGRHGTEGWLAYFPFTFAVKTPVSLLLALVAAVAAALKNKKAVPPWLWLPPVLFFAMACVSKVQIGHRHILAVYPFLFVIAGAGLNGLFGARSWIAAPLFVWLAAGVWNARPNFLPYFNEFVGGSANGYKYLTDSNVDWGQGLKELGETLSESERANGIYLSYFGVADPRAYGIRFLDVGSERIVGRIDDTADASVKPTALAISVTNLQCTYYADKTAFDWLKKYEPARRIGHSIFVYDFSATPDALEQLRRLRS